MQKKHNYEIYALLWVSDRCTRLISNLLYDLGIPNRAIERDLHLTVYYGRRPLPGLVPGYQSEHIIADSAETRFMVLARGGENPRPEYEPNQRSVGIRLTRRNQAIKRIQTLRSSIYCLETTKVIGDCTRTSAWKSCFGPRNYQPHIKLLRPNSGIQRDLRQLGTAFRTGVDLIEFDRFQVRCGPIGNGAEYLR